MPTEIWKDIAGYEGLYQVSNFGRVKSLDRTVEYTRVRGNKEQLIKSRHRGHIMALAMSGSGYLQVPITHGNDVRVHRLVAEASRRTGTPVSTISGICNHRRSGDKTMHWEFINQ